MKHTKLDWTKPLQTTDGVKAELRYTLKGSDYHYNRVVTLGDKDVFFDEDGHDGLGIQIINTPETKLVEFVINNYDKAVKMRSTRLYSHQKYADHDVVLKGAYRTNRIDFSMQLEPGKNYEVTGVKEVQ